jgi:Domain of unknown function (DUF1707)/Cell wall-active antibiotics response 4TMS YvqF
VHPEPFNANSRLRASDADREEAAAVLNAALAEGRLTVAEHSDRLDSVYEAKTHAQIAPLIDDLPAKGSAVARAPGTDVEPASGRSQKIIAIFGGASRKGRWHVSPKINAVTVFGGAELDFREAQFPAQEVTLNCTCIFGGVDITVPPEVKIVESGVAIFGGHDISSNEGDAAGPDAPVLRLTGLTLFGGVSAKHKQRKEIRQRKNRDR